MAIALPSIFKDSNVSLRRLAYDERASELGIKLTCLA